MARWCTGLTTSGLYKEGVVDGSFLESILESHRRETASTFGTRRSCRKSTQTSTAAVPESADHDAKENVSIYLTFLTVLFRLRLQAVLSIVPFTMVAYTAMK